jgi:hypothetical protein
MKKVREWHSGVELSQEEMIRIATWIDSNAQYYGTYFGKKNIKYRQDEDFRPVPTITSALGDGEEGSKHSR